MAREEQAMSDARLAEIRTNVSEMWKSHITREGVAGALEQAHADCDALLCEVYEMREQHEQLAGFYDMAMHALKQIETLNERLRAREAALVAVVERVAVVDIAERIIPRAVIRQARALLASESEQKGGGDGALLG